MDTLRAALSFGGFLSEPNIERARKAFETRDLKPEEHLLQIGEVCREVTFVESGILRVFAIDIDGREVTKYFTRAGQFIVELDSYYNRTPSENAFQAVVPTRVHIIQQPVWQRLNEEIPQLFILSKSLTEATLLNKLKDNDFLNFGTARDKYQAFLDRYPDLALRVPQQYIASYLKITPQSLSRIRRQVQSGDRKSDG